MCKAGLSFHEDVKTDAVCKACTSGCWPCAWTDASGLMAVTLCVCAAFRHVVWLCWLMGDGLSMGQAAQNVYLDVVWAAECWAEAP